MSEHSQDPVDPEELLQQLQELADRTKAISENVRKAPIPVEGEGAQLISDIAGHLATIREASDLPSQDAAQFERNIRQRQSR
jgi:hypothetical protein